MPADRTRIESNPLERMAELEASTQAPVAGGAPPAAGRSVSPRPIPSVSGKPGALPRAPSVPAASPPAAKPRPVMPPSGPLPLPPAPEQGPSQAAGRASGERFPNLSHLPTQIADADNRPQLDPLGQATVLQPADAMLGNPPQVGLPPPPGHQLAQAGYQLAQAGHPPQVGLPPPPGPLPRPAQPGAPPGAAANLPSGYPVMDARMSQQMLSGNVYPSGPGSGGRPSVPPASGVDSGARPIPSSGPYQMPPAGQAASLMSPVGQQYPQRVDWAEAAAAPARALPSWMLAVLFIGAIGVALTITILIARLLR